jgi:RimJ/RimL family protein N-acetyltransferase
VTSGPTIETPRLILRPHRLEDYEACHRLHRDPEAVRLIYQQPLTREESWHRLLRYVGHWTLLGYGLLIVEERVTGHVVGEVGLADFHRGLGDDFDPWPEFAWMISSHVHGRGYATEAAQAMLDWADAAFAPAQTVCMIDPDNQASLRVAAKLGFHQFGHTDYKGKPVVKLHRFAVVG